MKKIVAMAMTLCLMLGVAVAENENTFTGTAKGFGGDVSVTITVEDGKITDALVTGDNETPSIGGQAVETLGGAIVEAQSAEFDSVSGATVTSSAVREALKDAMRQAGLMEAASQTMTAGTYEFTYRGYCSNVTVATTVSETAIEQVEVVSNDETVGIGSYAIERIPAAIVENQTAGVDGVSGATATSNAILSAVRDALNAAGADMAIYNRTPEAPEAVDETYDTDVVVVGAGAAGFAAAVTALQDGADVIVLEKMDIPGGNTVRSSGVWNVAGPDQKEIDDFVEYTMKGGHYMNNEALVRVMVEGSWQIGPWLKELGFPVNEKGSGVEGLARGLITDYYKKVEELGGQILYATKAEKILMNDGKACGIEATSGMITNNQVGATGDGIYMAEAVGANLVDMDQIQAHPTVEQSTATLITEGVRKAGGILLNAEGKRFTDECNYRDIVAGAILEQTGAYAYIVFNQDLYDNNGNIPTYDKLGIVAHCANTDEIAAYIGCDAQTVADSFAAWNTACENKNDPEFASEYDWERNITTSGPWYVIKIAPGIHHTMGGIQINTETEVISTEGTVIPSLYACGEVTGGVHGGNRVGGNALIDCQVFGRIAGEQAAKNAQ